MKLIPDSIIFIATFTFLENYETQKISDGFIFLLTFIIFFLFTVAIYEENYLAKYISTQNKLVNGCYCHLSIMFKRLK